MMTYSVDYMDTSCNHMISFMFTIFLDFMMLLFHIGVNKHGHLKGSNIEHQPFPINVAIVGPITHLSEMA